MPASLFVLLTGASGALLHTSITPRHGPARTTAEVSPTMAVAGAAWAGEYSAEAAAAAAAVQRAMQLCNALACDMEMAASDPSGGKTMDTCDVTAGVAIIKAGDSTPVTAGDFAIQGLVAKALKAAFPEDRFMGEEVRIFRAALASPWSSFTL